MQAESRRFLAPVVGLLLVALSLSPALAARAPEVPPAPVAGADALAWSNAGAPSGGFVRGVGGSGDALVASTSQHGAYRSVDGGESWTPIAGFPSVVEARVVWDPTDARVGYVVGYGGVARTLDAGATWDHVIVADGTYGAAVHPTGRVVVLWREPNFFQHVAVSDDKGTTWRDLGAPIGQKWLEGVAFGRTADEIVVVDSDETWLTHDGGATWSYASGGGFHLAGDDSGALWRVGFEPLARSTDGGVSWTPVPTPRSGSPIAAAPGGGLYVVAPSEGFFLTRDGGASWTLIGFPEATWGVTSVVPDPTTPDAFFVTDEAVGIVRIAPDGNGGFELATRTNGLPPVDVYSLGRSGDGSLLLAGTPIGLFASRDGGDSWQHTRAGMGTQGVRAAAASADGKHVYAGGSLMIYWPFVMSSRDGGLTFTSADLDFGGDGRVVGIAVDPADGAHAFAAVWGDFAPSRVYETRDGGLTWTSILKSKPKIHDVAWHAPTGDVLVATKEGVKTRTPLGEWVAVTVFSQDVRSVASEGGVAFAGGLGSQGSRVTRSLPTLPILAPWAEPGNTVLDVAATPDGAEAWVTTQSAKLFRCTGSPVSGACVDETPPSGGVMASLVSADGKTAFAATLEGGLWKAMF